MAVLTQPVETYRAEAAAPLQAWPFMMMISLYPLWFLLGLSGFMWVVLAVPMGISLLQRRNLVVPKGFGWWALFIAAAFGSVLSLDAPSQLQFFSLRIGYYVSATIFLLYLINGGSGISVPRIIRAFTYLWMATVAGGYLAFLLGDFSFAAPFSYFLPQSFMNNELISVLVTPSFADVQDFLGFPVPRSKAPFPYTNSWGSMMGLLTPFALMSLSDKRVQVSTGLVKLGLVASVVPIVTSLNRGLWLSLGIGILYYVFRSGSTNQSKLAGRLLTLGIVGGAIYFLTPLGELIDARLSSGHSDDARGALVTEAIFRGVERPVFGWGTTRNLVPGLPPIGTHGQMWNLIFTHGIVGVVGWVGAMTTFYWKTRKPANQIGLWANTVIVISLVQMFFYLQVPHQLFTVLAAVVVAIRAKELNIDADQTKTPTEVVKA